MFVLGLLVLAAAVVGSVELILANRQPVTLHMWNWTWHLDMFWVAVIGAVLITAAWLALGAMRIAARHQVRLRRERRELAKENERLAARVQGADAKSGRSHFGRNRPAQPQQYPTAPPATQPTSAAAPVAATGATAAPAAPHAAPNTAPAAPSEVRR